MISSARPAALLALLEATFGPGSTAVIDDSHHHAGHAGAAGGAGHFRVRVVSDRFQGVRTLARHRLVYAAAAAMIPDDIHALSIEALDPAEAGPPPRGDSG